MSKPSKTVANYTEEHIKSLSPLEHIRLRPGMYIGKLGDGSMADDGLYVLVKEVCDNSIDEFMMGAGKKIKVTVDDKKVTVRDYGRGIPLGKVIDCVSKINTGGKYDTKAFKASIGLNGVGTKAVNAVSSHFKVVSYRDGEMKEANFQQGKKISDFPLAPTKERNGTYIEFIPDEVIFEEYRYRPAFLDELFRNYAYLNTGLTLTLNERSYKFDQGLKDLLNHKVEGIECRYDPIHFKDEDIEIAFTHTDSSSEEYYSFVNGQYTRQGGTHETALKEALVKIIRDFYKKDFYPADIRAGLVAAILLRVEEPNFESQTKVKLGSRELYKNGPQIKPFILQTLTKHLDNFLHENEKVAESIRKRIKESEIERKELSGIKKKAKERATQTTLYNSKLKDCKFHRGDKKNKENNTMLFIVEGDSAAGSITASRDVNTQAVYALKGKPLNTHGMGKRALYDNEELFKLMHALGLEGQEDYLASCRFDKVVLATDADVDGSHIRLLLLNAILQYFPKLIRNNMVYILETPIFRVRNNKETIYCYSENDKNKAIQKIKNHEITRFKGLGEIGIEEFEEFLLEPRLTEVVSPNEDPEAFLRFFMGKNTPQRQQFVIENLKDIER